MGAVLVISTAVFRWRVVRFPVELSVVAASVVALGYAAAVAFARRKSLLQVAEVIDRAGKTHDRFLTALAFSESNSPGAAPSSHQEMQRLAVRECVEFVRNGRFERLVQVRWPRQAVWLLVPIISVMLLQWQAQIAIDAKEAQIAEARSTVEDTAKKLEALAREAEKAQAKTSDEKLKRMAERLKQGADQLRAQAISPEEAAKAQMRELSALEQLAQEMQKSQSGATSEEMKTLAEALAKNEETQKAADALKAGDLEKAAAELEQALKDLQQRKDEKTADALSKDIQEALKQLAAQQQLSEAMQKLAQQMQQSQQGKGASSEAMQKLAQMLRRMQQQQQQGQGQSQKGGGSSSQQSLESLLAALQNMKYGQGEKDGGSKPQDGKDGKGSGMVAMQSFSNEKSGQTPGAGDPNMPSGHPGSEHDEGTTDSVFGKDRKESVAEAQAKQISGTAGEGENSMQQFIPSASDNSKSNRRYKELYNAMAPAAEDAVLQENIPLGSRFFIKRYFEAIRPKE